MRILIREKFQGFFEPTTSSLSARKPLKKFSIYLHKVCRVSFLIIPRFSKLAGCKAKGNELANESKAAIESTINNIFM